MELFAKKHPILSLLGALLLVFILFIVFYWFRFIKPNLDMYAECVHATDYVACWERYADSSETKPQILGSSFVAPGESYALGLNRTLFDGKVGISIPNDFQVATSTELVSIHSYIPPPCDSGFNLCVYYNDSRFKKTNFGSAGVGVSNLSELTATSTCLNTSPNIYYPESPTTTLMHPNYAASIFPDQKEVGLGHFASGNIYRLYISGSCYEFETRISQTNYGNYEPGKIQQFTSTDQQLIQEKLQNIIEQVYIIKGDAKEYIQWPIK